MRNLIAAIDLGTSKVVCLVGEKTETGVKIIAINEAPTKGISRGEVINIQSVLDAMTPTIRNVENAIGEKINDVFVGIAGQAIRCQQGTDHTARTNPDELITAAEIDQITKKMYGALCMEGEEVIHAVPQSYNIDDFMGITEPVGMNGKQIYSNFKLIIGKKNSSQQKTNVLQRARLNLKGMFLQPLASAKAVLDDEEREVGVALLDIGGGTTDLIIIQDNVVRHAAVIPFGGNSITEDLKQGCGVSTKVAEQLKTLHGSCMSSIAPDKNVRINGIGGREDKQISLRNIAEIIESRVEEILEAAMYEIERSGYGNLINSGIVITGGTSQLTNLQQFARLVTGMDIRLAVPNRMYAEIEVPINKPALSTAVGLVVMGFEKMEKEGVKYTSTTPINYKEELKEKGAEKPAKETSETQTNKAQEPKKKKGFGFGNFFNQFKDDNMFTDNEA
jgi:cell division protein FtsA